MWLNAYKVPQDELTIGLTSSFQEEDLSGETSSTATAHKGIKPKQLNVSFLVRYKDPEKLALFYRIAEATDDNGDLVVYNIVDRTANAVNVRQVKFTGVLYASELSNLMAWRVNFSLREHLSVPEKTEQRKDASTTEPDTSKTDFENVASYSEQQLA